MDLIVPAEDEVNEAATAAAKASPSYREYLDWLERNGCDLSWVALT